MFFITSILCLLNLLTVLADGESLFVEENGFFTIVCPFNVTFTTLMLQIQPGALLLAQCNANSCPDEYILSGVECVTKKDGFYFNITATDTSLLRTKEMVQCVYSNTNVISYNISLVARPQNVSCNFPTLTDGNTYVKISCQTTKVYPKADFKITVQTQQKLPVPGFSSCTSTNYTDTALYFNTICTWTSSLVNFDAGNYTFNASFYPSNTSDSTFEVNVKPLQALQLSTPKMALSNECFTGPFISQGFIKPRASIDCICYLKTIGYPPGNVTWLNSGGMVVGTTLNSTAQQLSTSENMDSNIYNCTALTTLKNQKFFITFQVDYAKIPSKCDVRPENSTQTVWNMCKSPNIILPIVCSVNNSDVKPGLKSFISTNLTAFEVLNNETINNTYKAKYEAIISEAGNITTTCKMQNSVFEESDVSCRHSQVLQVIASPKSDPILKINLDFNTKLQDVEENKDYVLECSVLGGVPPVSSVTVSCGNITESTQSGNIFTSPVTFTKNMTGQNCSCTAQHLTGCYDNKSFKHLNIKYSPIIANFPQSTLYVESGYFSELICIADGNPPPLINITKGMTLLNQTTSGNVSFKKTMTCRDTGQYSCQADNGIYNREFQTSQEKHLMIYVKCMLQFDRPENLTTEFSYVKGDFFSYGFIIYGYPMPSNITFSKLDRKDNNLSISYSTSDPPYTYVNLNISKLTAADFSNYTVTIFQTESQILTYTFYIKEVNQTNKPLEDFPLAAAIGGGIAAGCFVILLVILLAYLFKKGICHKTEEISKYLSLKTTTMVDNSDIYFLNIKIKDLFFNKKEKSKTLKKPESETYKNYQDIIPTITSATAAPKNLYKPEVKPKPKVNNETDYYNFVEPKTPFGLDVSDKKQLLDENVYANQGFNIN